MKGEAMATIRLWRQDGRHCDVPEDHEWISEYRKAYPLTSPPEPAAPKPAPKKTARNA